MLQTEPALANYKYYIENLVRLADHILPAEMEELLAKSRLATGTGATAFRSLVSADMQFPKITDGNGNEATVSEGNYLLNISPQIISDMPGANARDAMASIKRR